MMNPTSATTSAATSTSTEDHILSMGSMIMEDPTSYMELMAHNDDELAESLLPTTFFLNEQGHSHEDATATLMMMDQDELNDIAGLLAPPVSDDDDEAASLMSGTEFPSCSSTTTAHANGGASGQEKLVVMPTLPKLPPLKLLPKNAKKSGGSPTTTKKRFLYDQEVMSLACHTKKAKTKAAATNRPVEILPAPVLSLATVIPASPPLSATKVTMPKDAAMVVTAPKVPTVPSKTAASEPANIKDAKKSSSDRAQQCRDRNRQHAKNTRLRKKAFVESLKESLTEMVQERDAKLLADQQAAHVVVQQREVRFQVMQDFLQLKGRNETAAQRWAAILSDGFSVTQPVTPFQHMVGTTTSTDPYVQTLQGVDQLMADTAYFHQFLQSLGSGSVEQHRVNFAYSCDRQEFFMDGSMAVLPWTATSEGVIQQGPKVELKLYGTMKAKFCPETNKLDSAVLHFDTGAVQSFLSASNN